MEFLPESGLHGSARLLTPEETASLEPAFKAQGQPLPDPQTSFFVGCVENGVVVGWLCVQLRVHAEPMYLEDGHQAKFNSIVHKAEQIIRERIQGACPVFLFAPNKRIAELAEKAGLELEPWYVLSKTVEQLKPVQPLPVPTSEPEFATTGAPN